MGETPIVDNILTWRLSEFEMVTEISDDVIATGSTCAPPSISPASSESRGADRSPGLDQYNDGARFNSVLVR